MRSTWLRKISNIIDKVTDQGVAYNFGYDVAQKITFFLTLLVLWCTPWGWGKHEYTMFVFCCIIGRAALITNIEIYINKKIEKKGGRKSDKRFLNMSSGTWKLIVLVVITYLAIKALLQTHSVGEFIMTLIPCIAMNTCAFFIFGGVTYLAVVSGDPKKRGTKAWIEDNGVIKVNTDLMNPLYRDKYGNYYRGTSFRPVPPPINIVDKEKWQ